MTTPGEETPRTVAHDGTRAADGIVSSANEAARLVAALRETLCATLAPLVAHAPAIALLDFPSHPNVGDSAIWLGARAALRACGAPAPAYTCDAQHYDRAELARAIGRDGVILFTGGGSFGDVWETPLAFRARVVADFPGHRIVQLPESVHFARPEALARARRQFAAHPHFTMLVRDAASLAFMQREFRAPVHLAPDLAFALGPLARTAPASRHVLWLKRSDREDRWPDHPRADAVDWITDPPDTLIRATDLLRALMRRRAWLRPAGRRALAAASTPLAERRLARGLALLSTTRVLVTDRLHGHVLATLLGIPHVLLDNSYGKLHRFAASWTATAGFVQLATSPSEAAHAAHALQVRAQSDQLASGAERAHA